ncbi:MAG: DUF1427 family protein [Thermodesulfobacteriota bacterium]|nr:MAG: DUF1427 family protein [Thermodesulfobacteriota bacterium]
MVAKQDMTVEKNQMIETALALFAGITLGIFFRVLKLPIPAPNTISGVAGIFGIWLGYMIINWLKR